MAKLFSKWSICDPKTVLETLKTSEKGITAQEAQKRLINDGFNEIRSNTVSWWTVMSRQLKSSFTLILVAVVIFSYVLGEFIDGTMVFFFLIINVSLGFFQEFRSERSIQLLRSYITTKTHVFRGEKEYLIEARELVKGDLVVLEAGDVVPADLRLIEVKNFTVDESSLTGESVPVEKQTQSIVADSVFKAKNIVFSATQV